MTERVTNGFITAGWVAATIAGALTAYGAISGTGGLNRFNLIDAGIYFVLAFGIYRRSRICAALLLLYYGINQYTRIVVQHYPGSANGLILTAIFTVAYVLGLAGTIRWRRRELQSA